jgi:hypothetical protein
MAAIGKDDSTVKPSQAKLSTMISAQGKNDKQNSDLKFSRGFRTKLLKFHGRASLDDDWTTIAALCSVAT